MKFLDAEGVSPRFAPGQPIAVWIWHDGVNKAWHVRSTSKEGGHRISGRVAINKGAFKGVTALRLERADRIVAESQAVTFDFFTQQSVDGLDFTIDNVNCARFVLTIDQKPQTALIRIGKRGIHPSKNSFSLCN